VIKNMRHRRIRNTDPREWAEIGRLSRLYGLYGQVAWHLPNLGVNSPTMTVEPFRVSVGNAAKIKGISPQFIVDDLDRAIAYYRDKLGFKLDFTYESFYASISRDGFAIHLKHGNRADRAYREGCEHLDLLFRVWYPGALHRNARARR
jgi:hypothetical protein